jgi:hypothetical protein
MQSRHQPIENIRSRQLVSYPFILLSMVKLSPSCSIHLYDSLYILIYLGSALFTALRARDFKTVYQWSANTPNN